MATNLFFQNYQNSNEQDLIESLIVESIQIYGNDVYYMPRTITNYNKIRESDAQSTYEDTYFIDVYLKNVMGFMGNRNIMSKFAGLEIQDQVVFSMARRTFYNEIGSQTNISRPREGDLIYFALNKKCFQIKYVEAYEMMYQLGALQTWELTCELFQYSNEKINTGIPEIDRLQKDFSTNVIDYALLDENGNFLTDENGSILTMEQYDLQRIDPISDNAELVKQVTGTGLIDFSDADPFSEGKL